MDVAILELFLYKRSPQITLKKMIAQRDSRKMPPPGGNVKGIEYDVPIILPL
jgi:hypothetical protein